MYSLIQVFPGQQITIMIKKIPLFMFHEVMISHYYDSYINKYFGSKNLWHHPSYRIKDFCYIWIVIIWWKSFESTGQSLWYYLTFNDQNLIILWLAHLQMRTKTSLNENKLFEQK